MLLVFWLLLCLEILYLLHISYFEMNHMWSSLCDKSSCRLPCNLDPWSPRHSDMRLGQNLMRTFMDYYQLMGYISPSASDSTAAGGGREHGRQGDKLPARTASDPVATDNSRWVCFYCKLCNREIYKQVLRTCVLAYFVSELLASTWTSSYIL
jgi:hypothetical protein